MAKARKPVRKRFPRPGRQSKRDLEAWFFITQARLYEIMQTWPRKQQAEFLDRLQQLYVQRINQWRRRGKQEKR